MQANPTYKQARAYVNSVGIPEALKSNHYLTAKRHCDCGQCFCCHVRVIVDDAIEMEKAMRYAKTGRRARFN